MGAPVFVFMTERPSAGGALRAKEINWLLAQPCLARMCVKRTLFWSGKSAGSGTKPFSASRTATNEIN